MITIEVRNAGVQGQNRRFKTMLATALVDSADLGKDTDVTVKPCDGTTVGRGPLKLKVLPGGCLPDYLHREVAECLCQTARRFHEENGYHVRPVETTLGSTVLKID